MVKYLVLCLMVMCFSWSVFIIKDHRIYGAFGGIRNRKFQIVYNEKFLSRNSSFIGNKRLLALLRYPC